MSEEFEKIKKEVGSFFKDAENKIESEKRAKEEIIKKEELILEKSGVRQLFEEIRDNRLVELSPPSTHTVRVHKSFGRVYDEEKIHYNLARIETSSIPHNGVYVASLSLVFNSTSGYHNEVRVAVDGKDLCLVEFRGSPDNSYYTHSSSGVSFTPIKEGELATIIAGALKNPLKINDNW